MDIVMRASASMQQTGVVLQHVEEAGSLAHVAPSHATGKWSLVEAASCAAIAAGADGLIVEVHPRPEQALSDGAQSLRPSQFTAMTERCRRIATGVDRKL